MTVADLRAALADLPDDHLVILAKDSEGNQFGPLSEEGVGVGAYHATTTWYGDFWATADAPRAFPINAVCLWPVN